MLRCTVSVSSHCGCLFGVRAGEVSRGLFTVASPTQMQPYKWRRWAVPFGDLYDSDGTHATDFVSRRPRGEDDRTVRTRACGAGVLRHAACGTPGPLLKTYVSKMEGQCEVRLLRYHNSSEVEMTMMSRVELWLGKNTLNTLRYF